MRALIELSDIDSALAFVSDDNYPSIFLHGLLGIPLRDVADLLEISHVEVSRRYHEGLVEITHFINGGD
jgi:DNA-directed RNA polymerase specialized sigma24 family protein